MTSNGETYKEKYYKYKIKYNLLKEQIAGTRTTCPLCYEKMDSTKIVEHFRVVHNTIITKEEISLMFRERTNALKSSGKYDVYCKYCDFSAHANSALAYHILVKHTDLIIEDDFNFIDKYISNNELFKSKVSRIKLTKLERKFNKIPYSFDIEQLLGLNEEGLINYLSSPDEIKTRRQGRLNKTPLQIRRNFGNVTVPDASVANESGLSPDDLFNLTENYNPMHGILPESIELPIDLPPTPALIYPSVRFDVPPDFELNAIPIGLLFESIQHSPIIHEIPNMNCRYCGLQFNRYNLSIHLLSKHHPLINMEDLDFIKSIIPHGGQHHLRTIHIINKIKTKIISRDRQLRSVNFALPDIDLYDYNTFPTLPSADDIPEELS